MPFLSSMWCTLSAPFCWVRCSAQRPLNALLPLLTFYNASTAHRHLFLGSDSVSDLSQDLQMQPLVLHYGPSPCGSDGSAFGPLITPPTITDDLPSLGAGSLLRKISCFSWPMALQSAPLGPRCSGSLRNGNVVCRICSPSPGVNKEATGKMSRREVPQVYLLKSFGRKKCEERCSVPLCQGITPSECDCSMQFWWDAFLSLYFFLVAAGIGTWGHQ